jgi:hypothetical protein
MKICEQSTRLMLMLYESSITTNDVKYVQGITMAFLIEEKLQKCKKCIKTTKHHRNNSKSSGFMVLVHFILTVCTMGIWLILVILMKILETKIGGWKCSECDN